MKYEDFVIGERYLYRGATTEKVIAKVEATKTIVTLDEQDSIGAWGDEQFSRFQPLDKMAVFTRKTHELVTLGKELGYEVNVTIEKK